MDTIESIIRRIVREEIREAIAELREREPAPAPAGSQLMTIDEVAELLQVSKKTLYNWHSRTSAATGGPPPIKIGNRLRWERPRVEEWLRGQ